MNIIYKEKHFEFFGWAAQAVLKIVKHCRESGVAVTGQLLGLDIGATLEVTNCFAFPNQGSDHVDDYQVLYDVHSLDRLCIKFYTLGPYSRIKSVNQHPRSYDGIFDMFTSAVGDDEVSAGGKH